MQTYTHSTLLNLCLLCRRNQGGDRQEQWTPPGTELCRKRPRKQGRTVLCAGPGTAELSLGSLSPGSLSPPHLPHTPLRTRPLSRGVTVTLSHCHCTLHKANSGEKCPEDARERFNSCSLGSGFRIPGFSFAG